MLLPASAHHPTHSPMQCGQDVLLTTDDDRRRCPKLAYICNAGCQIDYCTKVYRYLLQIEANNCKSKFRRIIFKSQREAGYQLIMLCESISYHWTSTRFLPHPLQDVGCAAPNTPRTPCTRVYAFFLAWLMDDALLLSFLLPCRWI